MRSLLATMTGVVLAAAAVPAAAVTVTSVQITSAAGIPGNSPIQIAELQLFGGTTNYALGGTATATSTYVNGPAVPANAIDGNLSGSYPDIFHSNDYDGADVFTLTLSAAQSINRVSIFGRTDACCKFRDIYNYTFFNGSDAVRSGVLDARATSFATAAVPEPATWAMMIGGVGIAGGALRRRRAKVKTTISFA